MKKINVLIFGAGMFSIGRGTAHFGTILPTLFNLSGKKIVDKIFI